MDATAGQPDQATVEQGALIAALQQRVARGDMEADTAAVIFIRIQEDVRIERTANAAYWTRVGLDAFTAFSVTFAVVLAGGRIISALRN
jgi:hypothetical protein